ncbi:hypothetical protein PM8797T_29603 [Gimesia maris DSM 8797]|nr:hypothetical protein PM8797T_29603 [Gimesia maris DSM 8797]QGQ32677.1 DUF1553 domain-containing protein [Gimesia maris]
MVGRRILTVTGLTVEIKRGAVPVAFLISRIVALLRLALILSLTSFYVCPVHAGDAVPVARWDFSTEEAAPLSVHGNVTRDQAGPVPPEFPDFAKDNTAIRLDGKGAYIAVNDPGDKSIFDFTNGDAMTVEAWVKVAQIRNGQPMYVIGKGRTHSPHVAPDNQNWALRVVGAGDAAKLSFLFATPTPPGAKGPNWHRWTSKLKFAVVTGWHHIAVTYQFGKPDSIQGWIDGRPTDGAWDLQGATKAAPVVDNDQVWIGSSMGGNTSNSFNGWVDAIAVYRTRLNNKVITSHFHRLGGPRTVGPAPEKMPEISDVPPGKVLVTFSESMPASDRWLNAGEKWPQETSRWLGTEFLLPRIPLRYDDWGIRSSWKAPLLVRMAADVKLKPGTHRLLLRARALGRLWIDGKVVARTKSLTYRPPNGEEPITPLAEPPLPGARVKGYRMQEVFGEITIPDHDDGTTRLCRVVLELVTGGKSLRTETGEVCVAFETDDGNSYAVIRPQQQDALPLTDTAVNPVLAQIESAITRLEDETRLKAAASQDAFWQTRHAAARAWTAQHPAPEIPTVVDSGLNHPIDRFLASKIDKALLESSATDRSQAEHFHKTILPLLQENCFRCHGDKDKGGLRLNTRENALKSGDSEIPAIVPGDISASELLERIRAEDESIRMPPTGKPLSKRQIAELEKWIQQGAIWPAVPLEASEVALAPVINDEAFLKRIYLDTVGVPPTLAEVRQFLEDSNPDKRNQLIDRLLEDDRFADHWVSYWMDLLAENPTLLNASLNSTGPFRWFLYDALRDKKAFDRIVTELLLMRGSPHEGGSAGFAIAAENDSPFAAKGHIVASAFLGIELQCARCHDSPYHSTTQRDLFSLAAMMNRKPLTVPSTSRVPDAFFEKKDRESLIRVTLKPDETIQADWPFAGVTGAVDDSKIDSLMHNPQDTRERLAALITAPENERFANVIVNRLWKQLIGTGLVEPVYDWEGRKPSHPKMLDWLSRQFVTHDYDLNHVIRLIVTSQVYQREATGNNGNKSETLRFFTAPEKRRLTAEQIVDAMHTATGKQLDVEELTFVHDGQRDVSNRLSLGRPSRAWMFADLKNERDRPSLSLPYARTVTDVLEAFGWTGSRQKPIMHRETEPNVLQPGVLANGTLSMNLIRVSDQSELAQLAVDSREPGEIIEALYLRFLCRRPSQEELNTFSNALAQGFDSRLLPTGEIVPVQEPVPLPQVTWFNHLRPEANTIQQNVERRVRKGPPADPRFRPEWREIYEDIIWSLMNHREFVWIP